jgi:hypothetical protein
MIGSERGESLADLTLVPEKYNLSIDNEIKDRLTTLDKFQNITAIIKTLWPSKEND